VTPTPRSELDPRLPRAALSLTVAITFVFFLSFGLTLVVLPRYVIDELGGGDGAAGLVFAAYAVAAVLCRPLIGRFGDRRGRRPLIAWGGSLCALALAGHVLAGDIPSLLAARLLFGLGHAAVLVGVTTVAIDLAPASRRGEASSYVMVAIQLGVGIGPLVGELLLDRASYDAAWLAAAAATGVTALGAWLLPSDPAGVGRTTVSGPLVHPAGLRPGMLLGLGMVGFAGFLAFVPLYGPTIGIERVAVLFLLSSGVVAAVRLFAARVPDRLGARQGSRLALGLMTGGLLGMGLWHAPVGLYVTTVVMAAGMAFLAPTLTVAATEAAPTEERTQVMSSFTVFIDLGNAIGPPVLGLIAEASDYPVAFAAAGCLAGVGLVLTGRWLPAGGRSGRTT
jgi:MFS family permease